jgi:transmembrane sensor
MRHSDYVLADFVKDPSFQKWVFKTSHEDVLYWDIWLKNHPEKADLLEEAAQLVRGIVFNKNVVPTEEINQEWRILRLRLQQDQQDLAKPKSHSLFQHYRQLAAILLLLLTTGLSLWYLNQLFSLTSHRTAFGETATLVLPDGSMVKLHGNTTIRYPKKWETGQNREVWIQGEAFFSVVHTPTHDRFLVHLPGEVEVEVLGTEFNVTARNSANRVVLNSGSIRLKLPAPKEKDQQQDSVKYVLMKPGEMVQYEDKPDLYVIKRVNPERYTSWKDYRFVFDDTPLPEIAQLLEENYGFKVVIADPSLLSRKLTGEIETNNPDILLYALSKSFKIRIQKEKNTLFLYSSQ